MSSASHLPAVSLKSKAEPVTSEASRLGPSTPEAPLRAAGDPYPHAHAQASNPSTDALSLFLLDESLAAGGPAVERAVEHGGGEPTPEVEQRRLSLRERANAAVAHLREVIDEQASVSSAARAAVLRRVSPASDDAAGHHPSLRERASAAAAHLRDNIEEQASILRRASAGGHASEPGPGASSGVAATLPRSPGGSSKHVEFAGVPTGDFAPVPRDSAAAAVGHDLADDLAGDLVAVAGVAEAKVPEAKVPEAKASEAKAPEVQPSEAQPHDAPHRGGAPKEYRTLPGDFHVPLLAKAIRDRLHVEPKHHPQPQQEGEGSPKVEGSSKEHDDAAEAFVFLPV